MPHTNAACGDRPEPEWKAVGAGLSVAGVLIGVAAIIGAGRMEPDRLVVNTRSGAQCPSDTELRVLYYKYPNPDGTQYVLEDNSEFIKAVEYLPLTDSKGSTVQGKGLYYPWEYMKAADLSIDSFWMGDQENGLKASRTYKDKRGTWPEVAITVPSNRYLVIASTGSLSNARHVDIEYNYDSGLRTVTVAC